MNDLLVAGMSIGVDPIVYSGQYGGAIVDSGTNVFLLPHEGNAQYDRALLRLTVTLSVPSVAPYLHEHVRQDVTARHM